jgi:hypothetical protein
LEADHDCRVRACVCACACACVRVRERGASWARHLKKRGGKSLGVIISTHLG